MTRGAVSRLKHAFHSGLSNVQKPRHFGWNFGHSAAIRLRNTPANLHSDSNFAFRRRFPQLEERYAATL